MTIDEIKRIEETISFHGNNCGGCETCDQVFGSEVLTFDPETVWGLIKLIRSMEAKLAAAEGLAEAVEDGDNMLSALRAYRNAGGGEGIRESVSPTTDL